MATLADLRGAVAFSYARFSDPSQGAGHSIERQEEYAPVFCRDHGLSLNGSLAFRDEGKSAFKAEHLGRKGGLQRFLECIESGLVKAGDVLIVENLDRLSRLELSAAEQLLHGILSAGVMIHTRFPFAVYDRRTLNNPMERMQMIFEFTRSHRESRAKQERLSRRWERNRKHIKQGDYKLAVLPGWLKAKRSDDGKIVGYSVIEERASVVRRAYKLCCDGMGLTQIAKLFNQEGVQPFGRGKLWAKSSLAKLLRNRAVLGEHQSFTKVRYDDEQKEFETVKRVAVGDAVEAYYPAIIDEKTFRMARAAAERRLIAQGGRSTSKAENLFAGMLFDARDGSKMYLVSKDRIPRITSSAAVGGVSRYIGIPYVAFEKAFIIHALELPLSMLASRPDKKIDVQIGKLTKDVVSLESAIDQIKAKLRSRQSDALLELLVERDNELREARRSLEALERQRASTQEMAAKSSVAILKTLSEAKGEQLQTLRTKLRNELRFWIKDIFVLPLVVAGQRAAIVDVQLENGRRFGFRVSTNLVNYPAELDSADIRSFAKWPKELRRVEWETIQPDAEIVAKLDRQGLTLAQMQEKTGYPITKISRLLKSIGRQRSTRVMRNEFEQMVFAGSACGWVRTLNKKRYYVGFSTLEKLYPKLFKDRSRDGSRLAANRWWKDHGPA